MKAEVLKAVLTYQILKLDEAHTDKDVEYRRTFIECYKLLERIEEFKKWLEKENSEIWYVKSAGKYRASGWVSPIEHILAELREVMDANRDTVEEV